MLFLWIYKPPLRVSCWDTCRPKYVVQADKTVVGKGGRECNKGTRGFYGENMRHSTDTKLSYRKDK